MKKLLLTIAISAIFLAGCSSVPMEPKEETKAAQNFNAPSSEKSGIYIYRKDTIVGAAIKKDVLIDGECVGETAKGVFFYQEVDGNQSHTISTESEFSNNDLTINTNTGQLYFFEQYIKMGVFVGGAGIQQVNEMEGKENILELNLATKGNCG